VLGQQVPGEVAAQVAPHGVDVICPAAAFEASETRPRPRRRRTPIRVERV
jgi:hypothetical protein